MTLVVARVYPTGIRIVSDSKLTDKMGMRRGYLNGALKAVLLHPALCVAFAGNSEVGHQAIRQLDIGPDSYYDVDAVCSQLLEAHRRANHEANFIVASQKGPLVFRKIANGGVHDQAQTCWIGDHNAFEAYQRAWYGRVSDLSDDAAMSVAMQNVIDDNSVRSVGDLLVSVIPTRRGFIYATDGRMQGGRDQVIPSHTPTVIQFGNAAEGGFAFSVLAPQEPGIGAIGVHFYQGGVGILYYPVRLPDARPLVFRRVSHNEFQEAVFRSFGVTLTGLIIS